MPRHVAYRGRLIHLQGGICALCGRQFNPNKGEWTLGTAPTLDHVWPISKGGYDGIGNLLLAHGYCNTRKGSMKPTGCSIIWLDSVLAMEDRPFRMKPELEWRVTNGRQ